MSTLKTITVVHPSSAVNNITNDASGNVAVGGALTVGGVAAVAVAPGTNGNVLTSTGSAWTSTAPASTASLTLLATLTTTSGTTQSATGLATTYNNLVIVAISVTNSTATNYLQIKGSVNNGSSYSSTANNIGFYSTTASGSAGIATFIFGANQSTSIKPILTQYINGSDSFITTPSSGSINALQFSWASGYTFNGGTIYIYGWN